MLIISLKKSMVPKRYLVTSALPYANGPLHIGHLAGAYLSADAYVRYLRLLGKDVVYVCGSDEHGAAIYIRAMREGKTPKEIIDTYHYQIKEAFEGVGISFDVYHRTSEALHHETSQEFFRTLYKKGVFVEQETEQFYDEEAKQFLADRFIKGTCPKCDHTEAFGDQCENCGSTLSPSELVNPTSTLSGSIPVLRKTKHWYLPLDKHESWLREWILNGKVGKKELHNPADWKNHVIGQCKSWLESGLQPRAMTRDLDWGVDVPPEMEGSEGKKLYVWLDAPIGYISATKEWARQNNKRWEPYWQKNDTALIHFIGKDNIVFHCLIFPVILKTHGNFILPYNVPANQFMNLENRKVSTSKGWAVWIHEYLEDLPGKQDELRYYMFKTMPEQRDSEFTWKGYQDANNNELVNNLGNFINRVIVLVNKYYKGVVPEFDPNVSISDSEDANSPTWHDSGLLDLFDRVDGVGNQIGTFDFRGALRSVMDIASAGNQLLQFNEPWKKQKEEPETVKVALNLAIQYVAALSVICRPFLPFTSTRIRNMLNLPDIVEKADLKRMADQLSEGEVIVPAGHKINKEEHLFTRIPDEVIEEQVNKLQASENADLGSTESVKNEISIEDFSKLDLRTGIVVSAEKVAKTKKLLKLTVDLGYEKRTVVSGIAEHYNPKNIIGQEVVLVMNLVSRKIKGVESKGMILMAEDGGGQLAFVSPPKGWSKGSLVR